MKKNKRISLPPKRMKTLYKEFNVSRQSIYNALCYYTDSPLAREIRARAKELLEQELREIKI